MKKNKIGDSFIISKISPIPENYITRDVPYLGNRYSNEDLWNLYYDERIAYITRDSNVEDGEYFNVPKLIETSLSSGGFGMVEHINALYNERFYLEYSYISKDGYMNFFFQGKSNNYYHNYLLARSKNPIINESTDYYFLSKTFNITYTVDDFDYNYISLSTKYNKSKIYYKIASINKNKIYVTLQRTYGYNYSIWKGSNSDEANEIVLKTPMGIVYDLEANTSRVVRAEEYIAPRSINKQRPENPDAAINNYIFDIANTEEVTVITAGCYGGIDVITGEPVIQIKSKIRMYQTVGLPPVVSWAYYTVYYSCGFEAKKFSINYEQRNNYGYFQSKPFNLNGNCIIEAPKTSDYYDIYYNIFNNINFSYNTDTLYDYLKKIKSPFTGNLIASSYNTIVSNISYNSATYCMKNHNKYNYILSYRPGFDLSTSGSGYKTYFKDGNLFFERQGKLYQKLKEYYPELKEHSGYGLMEISENKEIYEKIFIKYIQEGDKARLNSYPDVYFSFIGIDSDGYYNLIWAVDKIPIFNAKNFATKKLTNKTRDYNASYLRINEDFTEIIIDNNQNGQLNKTFKDTQNEFLLKKYLGNECSLFYYNSSEKCNYLFNPYNRKDTYTVPAIFTGNDTDYRYVTKIKKTE